MRKTLVAVVALLLMSPFLARAQSFNPVIEENSVDGLLLGAEGSSRFFDWLEPSLGVAYGLQSQKIRYKAEVNAWLNPQSVGALVMLDWPRTPVLGRIGESGFKITLDLSGQEGWLERVIGGSSRFFMSGFFGRLWPWPHDPYPPDVLYIMWESRHSLPLPFGIEFGSSQQTFLGWWQLGVLTSQFRYYQTQLSLRRELLSLIVSYGTTENESKFPDFLFTQSVKGEGSPLKGEQFWSVRFERAFDIFAVPIPIPFVSESLEFLVQGAIFLQLASTAKTELPCCGGSDKGKLVWQDQLSWGLSVMISPGELGATARVDFVFTRDGRFHFLFNF
ncbi:MAG: hypothetical protein NZ930_07900 [Candidatus Bipolaricaulota bacterium]|nr:hypothetical protein [Candidatus Bipolaricaulota bacterium]MDW8031774.1 hypothetical protein [Candidatus Bipolaricaulota bacterium]